ncbi:exported protein of unknown function [Streptantibioticus cattleyicolor NRRL 8057 = DSM 46488]|nr:exported protein of unknown function [Streptantibioticus cattleyicolor NRRL 8057 = DSM 46488]
MALRAAGTVLAVGAVLLAAGCGGQRAAGHPATPATPAPASSSATPARPVQSAWPHQEELDKAANAVEQLGASYPDSYTGLSVDNEGDRLVVYRKPSAAFDAALAKLHTGQRIALRDAPRSQRELQEFRAEVEPLLSRPDKSTGYQLVSVSTGDEKSWTRGVVEVGVHGDLARARRDLSALTHGHVEVRQQDMPVG